jgi:hypothetical protein
VLSFTPTSKIEIQLKHLQSLLVETYKNLDQASEEEKTYLNKCALISNVGATNNSNRKCS